jgi:hypothetical protein
MYTASLLLLLPLLPLLPLAVGATAAPGVCKGRLSAVAYSTRARPSTVFHRDCLIHVLIISWLLSFLTLVTRGALLMLLHLLLDDAHGLLAARTRARSPSGLRRSSLFLHRLCCILLLVRGTSHELVSTPFKGRCPAFRAGSSCSACQNLSAVIACTLNPRQERV